MKWQKVNNGHTLTVVMDTEELISSIDEKIEELKDIAVRFEGCIEGDADDEEIDDLHYGLSVVNGSDEYFDPSECITDLEDMKECIRKLETDMDGNAIWSLVAFKKNGTFKRTCKPIIRQEKFGAYWEDSYGWNTEVLRIEPVSDIEACVVLTDIVVHY